MHMPYKKFMKLYADMHILESKHSPPFPHHRTLRKGRFSSSALHGNEIFNKINF